jgi:hypothetical protein
MKKNMIKIERQSKNSLENENDHYGKYIYIDENVSFDDSALPESRRLAIKKLCKILKDNEYEILKANDDSITGY